MNLNNYMDDGANHQAQATLAFLREFNVEESWDKELHRYSAEIAVARWDNGREHGYVLTLASPAGRSYLHIAFFEDRHSDSLTAWKFETSYYAQTPTWQDVPEGAYENRYSPGENNSGLEYAVNYGQVLKMADWIKKQFTQFWKAGRKAADKAAKEAA